VSSQAYNIFLLISQCLFPLFNGISVKMVDQERFNFIIVTPNVSLFALQVTGWKKHAANFPQKNKIANKRKVDKRVGARIVR
jgi:hypothetical protein